VWVERPLTREVRVERPLVREEHARLRTRRRLPSGIQVAERGAISGIMATNIRTCLSLAKPETSRPVSRLEEGKEWRMQVFSRAPPVAVIRTVVEECLPTRVATPVLPSHDACSDTCNDTCIALSGHVQRHLYFDLLGRSAWSLLASVAGTAGLQYDAVF
jgi:hypothetical protein